MLCAAIKDCPVFGGKVKSYDEAKIAGMPGVRKVVKVKDTAVAVVADTWWRAKTALDALPIVWDEGPGASASDATIAAHLKEGLTATETNGERQNGDALKAIADAAKKVEAVYSTPFLSHACMEPMNATVKLSADKAEVWAASQNIEASLAALSEVSGVPLAKCEVYRLDLGGGFGRRGGTQDYIRQAVDDRQGVPGRPGQADLEPRGGSGARLLPADLAMQDVGWPRRGGQPRRDCTFACRGSRSMPR